MEALTALTLGRLLSFSRRVGCCLALRLVHILIVLLRLLPQGFLGLASLAELKC